MRVVFTNGVFDILHRGHIEYLTAARALGSALVVGINSDASTAKLKPGRPVVCAEDRRVTLLALKAVDMVLIFNESTATELVRILRPAVYVKGGDYEMETVPEAIEAKKHGALVLSMPYLTGYSTSALLNRIRA